MSTNVLLKKKKNKPVFIGNSNLDSSTMVSQTAARPAAKREFPYVSSEDASPPKKRRGENSADGKENNGVDRPSVADDLAERQSEHRDSLLAGRHRNEQGKPPEAGVIREIYVENFMCHKKLRVQLCRNVNFIHGQNGSGKSAILAAIQICLGAGARRTHRARNLKDLVRKDSNCNAAKVQVTLLNRGDDAYQHELYGDAITVERTIAVRGGYNGYKLYNHDMEEISRNKKDLDEMLDKLNIQVENPCAILDQEDAKKFLTGKASDKYEFFMRATELERLDRKYAATLDMVRDLDNQSTRLNGALETYIEQANDAKKRHKEFQKIEELENKKETCEELYAWSLYNDAHEKLVEKREERDAFQAKAQKKIEELSQAEGAAQGPDEEETNRRNNLDRLTREADEQAGQKQNLEVDLKRASEPYKALSRRLKETRKDIGSAERSLASAKQQLESKRAEILARAGSAESEAAGRTKRLQDAEARLANAKEDRDRIRQAVSDSRKAYDELEPQVEQARHEVSAGEKRLMALNSRIRELEKSGNSSINIFGRRCGAVHDMVQKARFQGPVLGPIGAFVKIAPGKEMYAPLAELAIGSGMLDRFIVTNDNDRKILQGIRRKIGCQHDCGILQIHPHAKYSVQPPPVDGIDTVASVLQISNDLVYNSLVDYCKIEEKALSKSKKESEDLLLHRGNDGRLAVRGRIKTVFFLPKGDSWNVKNGTLGMSSNEKQLRQTIGVDKSKAIAETRNEMQAVQHEVNQHRREDNRLNHEHTESMKEWNKGKGQLRKVEKELDKARRDIESLQEDEIQASNFDTDTSEHEQLVTDEQATVDALKDNEVALIDQLQGLEPGIEELKSKLNETKARNERVMQDMTAAEEDLANYIQHLSQRQEKLEKKRNKVKQYEEIIEKKNIQINESDDQAKSYLLTAKTLAFHRQKKDSLDEAAADSEWSQEPTHADLEGIERPDQSQMKKDPKYYKTRLERLKERLQTERERRNAMNEDPIEAYEKYIRAQKLLESKMEQIKEIDETSKNLKSDWNKRKQRWRQFRQHIALTTDGKFNEILNDKGSSGTVEFNHKDATLNLCVQKDATDANSQQKDVKALSGGERSYTTIALLLALGESLETPFRVLDEFDVFLDPVTRKTVIDTLILMAKKMNHRQFIFITPQDVSNVDADPMLKIIKMTPPTRRDVAGAPIQQVLEFSQN
ncbi:unnamed protein product [Cylindrotheca closterium]|uniref:Rad50/SbcC-type AAA domain-containing protein n=1 Tax=Cylindrotheca closterium TaxID=2856 RepID=A0AAD2G7S0_9STRA|nr:unnamed protein product [Cylindrotheca closterium]